MLTVQEAISKIGTEGYTTVEGLLSLVSETSAAAKGATENALTLLYSKNIGEINAFEVAENLSNNSKDSYGKKQIVTVGDSDVAALLKSEMFRTELLS
ncbi:MAG: hypothetical protein CTY34_12325 [Methylobacter sp.]|nr:MAG: hypothetical protein CTY34_12325 [Methylobacter sp.]